MPDTHHPPRFNVIASNIHTGVHDTHGPYTGHPRLTYDTLHSVNEDTDDLELIFQFINPEDIEDREYNPHDYNQWEDSEGRPRYDGWRRLTRRPFQNRPDTWYYQPDGPFYTDLCLVPSNPHRHTNIDGTCTHDEPITTNCHPDCGPIVPVE